LNLNKIYRSIPHRFFVWVSDLISAINQKNLSEYSPLKVGLDQVQKEFLGDDAGQKNCFNRLFLMWNHLGAGFFER